MREGMLSPNSLLSEIRTKFDHLENRSQRKKKIVLRELREFIPAENRLQSQVTERHVDLATPIDFLESTILNNIRLSHYLLPR